MATQFYVNWQGEFATNTYTLVNPPEVPNSHEITRNGANVDVVNAEAYGNSRLLRTINPFNHEAGLIVPEGAQLDHNGGSLLIFVDADSAELSNNNTPFRWSNPSPESGASGFFRIRYSETFGFLLFFSWDEGESECSYQGDWINTGHWIWVRLDPANGTANNRLQFKRWLYGDPIPDTFTSTTGSGAAASSGIFAPLTKMDLFVDAGDHAALGLIVIDDDPDADLSGFVTGGAGPAVPVITETTPLKSGQPLTITGTNFSASGNTVILSPTTDHEHTDAETQVIDSEGATEIVTEAIVLPDGAGPTDGLYLFVEDDDSNLSEPFPIEVAYPIVLDQGDAEVFDRTHNSLRLRVPADTGVGHVTFALYASNPGSVADEVVWGEFDSLDAAIAAQRVEVTEPGMVSSAAFGGLDPETTYYGRAVQRYIPE